jgi:hypothetical protein
MGWRHVRLGPGLVDEDQASRIEIGLRAQPGGASSLDIRAVELGRRQRLFLRVIPSRSKNRRIEPYPTTIPASARA